MSTERTQQHLYELNTESRLTKLESTNEMILKTLIEINSKIDKLDSRLWQLLFVFGGGFLTLLTIMAHGFRWI